MQMGAMLGVPEMKKTVIMALLGMAACSMQPGVTGSVLGDPAIALNDNVFEVAPRNNSTNFSWDVWCGASDFARRQLNANWQDPVYVYRERGPGVSASARETVHFTLNEQVLPVPASVMTSVDELATGQFMTVRDAGKLCDQWAGR